MKIFLLLATTFCVSGISAAAVPKIEPEEQHAAIGKKPQQQKATPAAIARRQLPFSSSLAVTTSDSRTLNLNYTTISTTASPVITTTATAEAEAEAEAVANPAGLLKSFLPLPPLLPLPPSPTKCTPSSICVDKISICADFSRKRYGGYVDLSYFTLLFSPFFSRLLLLFVSPVCSFFFPLFFLFFSSSIKAPPSLPPKKKGGKKKRARQNTPTYHSFPLHLHLHTKSPPNPPTPLPPPQHHADTTTITIIITITTIIPSCIDARIIYEWNGMS